MLFRLYAFWPFQTCHTTKKNKIKWIKRSVNETTSTSPGCFINPPADSKLRNPSCVKCPAESTVLRPQLRVSAWWWWQQWVHLQASIDQRVFTQKAEPCHLYSSTVSRNTQPWLLWRARWARSVCGAVYSMLLCARCCCWGMEPFFMF